MALQDRSSHEDGYLQKEFTEPSRHLHTTRHATETGSAMFDFAMTVQAASAVTYCALLVQWLSNLKGQAKH